MRRLLWRNLDLELAAGCVASDFGRKLSTGRADFELLDRKIFARFHDDCLWLGRFASVPINQRRLDLHQLGQHGFKREDRSCVRELVGFHGHGFHLRPGAIADFKRRGDFAFIAGHYLVLLCLRGRATTGGMDRFKVDHRFSGILVFEMADRFLIGNTRMQLDLGLFPFQFGAGDEWKQDRQRENENAIFHFWK